MQRTPVSPPVSSLRALRRQAGFSLVELMVGITVGLLVVVAAIGSLAFTQASSTVVVDSAGLQQKADAIFRNIAFHVEQAGANNAVPSGGDPAKIIFSPLFTGFDPAITLVPGLAVHGQEGASNAPDTLRVSYQDDGTGNFRDCMGNLTDAPNIRVDNQFSVDNGNLMCKGADAKVAAQSIADGVEDFQVTYGVRTAPAGGVLRYQYFPAAPALDWKYVHAVSICLQLAGETQGNPRVGDAFIGCRGQNIANDGKIRRLFRRTFNVRNAPLL